MQEALLSVRRNKQFRLCTDVRKKDLYCTKRYARYMTESYLVMQWLH